MAGLSTTDLTAAMTSAYDDASASWTTGVGGAYDRLAEVLVATAPVPLTGALVLDLGAGTGAASRAVDAVGGRTVAVDLSLAMLAQDRPRRPAVGGDACALPFRDHAFDTVVAAFSLSHLPDPELGLAEAARVTRHGGTVLASAFSAANALPGKEAVEKVAARFGYRRPEWYGCMKTDLEPKVADPGALAAMARSAGLIEVDVSEHSVDLGTWNPGQLVAWRLSGPSLAGFVGRLSPPLRAEFRAAAEAALGAEPQPFQPAVLILSSRSGPKRNRPSA